MPCVAPIPGTPTISLPINGGRIPRPANKTLDGHLYDRNDPHNTKSLVPALRTGTFAPSVLPTDKPTDLYFDTATNDLYVCVLVSGTKAWKRSSGGSSSSSVAPTTDVYNKSEIVNGVQHFKKQVLSYDQEMESWSLAFLGDYVLSQDGTYTEVVSQ